jgi:hypothetical protein
MFAIRLCSPWTEVREINFQENVVKKITIFCFMDGEKWTKENFFNYKIESIMAFYNPLLINQKLELSNINMSSN